jgi:HEAT repeat protein
VYVFVGLSLAAVAANGQPEPSPAPKVAPVPPAAPVPPVWPSVPEFEFDFDFDVDVQIDRDRIRAEVDRARDEARRAANLYGKIAPFELLNGRFFPQAAPMPPMTPMPPFKGSRGPEGADRYYRRGTEYLDRREWEKAIEAFDRVIQGQGTRSDGAYYWRAYAQHRLGRRQDALATLAELQKNFPQSRWLNDAKLLETEVKAASGQAPSPESEADEDLKLYAIGALLNTDPERAVPLLGRILSRNNPPKLKERALFVLAQTRSPKANEIVASFARGNANPDLQAKAVEYLGVYGGRENMQILSDVYNGNSDPMVRRAVLRSYMIAKDKDKLVALAKTEQNPELRRQAISYLGSLRATQELADLYKTETSSELRRAILSALSETENAERLIEIARSEKDPKLRAYTVKRLGDMNRTRTADALVSIYGSETDRDVKAAIISALEDQNSAKELVTVARSEKDPELKKLAVKTLSQMKSKEASDYLMELIDQK